MDAVAIERRSGERVIEASALSKGTPMEGGYCIYGTVILSFIIKECLSCSARI